MTLGILFSMMISWTIGGIGISQFFHYVRREGYTLKHFQRAPFLFAVFWFLMGIAWILVGVSDFFDWKNELEYSYFMITILEFVIGIDMAILWKYFLKRFFINRSHMPFLVPYIGAVALFEFSLLRYGFVFEELTFFSHSITINNTAQILFFILYVPIIISAVIDGVRAVISRANIFQQSGFPLLVALSILLLAIGGGAEQFGFVHSAVVPSARLLTLLSAMAGYIATTRISNTQEHLSNVVI